MANPTDTVLQAQLANQAAQLTPELRAYIAQGAIRSQKVQARWPYYSRIRLEADVEIIDPGPPIQVQYTIPAGRKVKAFSYGIDESMQGAGYPAGRIATIADTNLSEGRKTKDGERLFIFGVSCHVIPIVSDPVLLGFLFGQASVTFAQSSGDVIEKLGIPGFLPQTGGLFGAGESSLGEPYRSENNRRTGFVTNGIPHPTSYYPLPEEVVWNPSGKADSTLVMPFEMQQTAQFTVTGREDPADPLSPIQEYQPPSEAGDIGTFVELMVMLHARSVETRGVNQ